MHIYMYAMIKFHTYRDIISELISTVSRKGEKQLKDYQSYTAYPENESFKLHRQSTVDCVRLELSIIFKRLPTTFSF